MNDNRQPTTNNQQPTTNNSRRAFTLFEIVAVLTLLGVTAAFSGMMLSSVVQQFSLQREAAAMNQKVEATMARLVKELTWADPASVVISDAGATVEWESRHPDRAAGSQHTLTWSGVTGEDLLLDGDPLLNQVAFFAIPPETLVGGNLEVQLQTTVHSTMHTTLVYLRDDI